MNLTVLLWGIPQAMRAAAKVYPAYAARLKERNLVAQIRLRDAPEGRWIQLDGGKVRTDKGLHAKPDVTLFFDKQTSLLVKCETRLTDPNNKEITVEFSYSDFKDVDGVKHPMKIKFKAEGGEFGIEISEIQPKDKVDDSEFAKP